MRRARLTVLSDPELRGLLDVYDAGGPQARSVELELPPRYTILLLALWHALEQDRLLPADEISPLRIGRRRYPYLAASTLRFHGWRCPAPEAVRRYARKLERLLADSWEQGWPGLQVPQLFDRHRTHGVRLALELDVRGHLRDSWLRDPPEDPSARAEACGNSSCRRLFRNESRKQSPGLSLAQRASTRETRLYDPAHGLPYAVRRALVHHATRAAVQRVRSRLRSP